MRTVNCWRRIWKIGAALVVLGAGLLLVGCASTDDADNVSERPWNAPRNWEGGLPAGMMEGR